MGLWNQVYCYYTNHFMNREDWLNDFWMLIVIEQFLVWPPIYSASSEKNPSRGILRKRCSENMQQIYGRTRIAKCDFKKVPFQHGCSPVNLLHIFRTPFLSNNSGGLLLYLLLGVHCSYTCLKWCLASSSHRKSFGTCFPK